MKLSEWAKQNGLSYRTAHRLFRAGKLPCHAEQLATGTILVHSDDTRNEAVVLYGRVSSHDQRKDLDRQMSRLRDFASANGMRVVSEKSEVGSGLNDKRKVLLSILSDRSVTKIIVEHRDRLARFGVEYLETALKTAGVELCVVNETENDMDIVQDFVDVVTSMCARIYGKRSAKNRAKRALEAAGGEG
jgi:predicted site-specific integrase-resolvase